MSVALPPDGKGARARPRVGLACSDAVRRTYVGPADVSRLQQVADFVHRPFDVPGGLSAVPRDRAAETALAGFAADLDALIVCHGAPFVSAEVLAAAPRLRFVGELEGDRFGYHFDIEAAAAAGVKVVDTTHGSSWPTAEWALALALVGLRNAGEYFRRMIAHQPGFPGGIRPRSGPGFDGAELTAKRVGMIGFGHVGRRLAELLAPFRTEIVAYDPFAPRELAAAYGIAFASLQRVLDADVVWCLVPLTPGTRGMLGAEQLELLRPGSVFVNVSRGAVVDSGALVARLRRGDLTACLDVFDPEPVPLDSPILDLPNVFVSPHVGGVTDESRRRFFELMVGDLLRHFDGLEPLAELTPRVVALRNSGREDSPSGTVAAGLAPVAGPESRSGPVPVAGPVAAGPVAGGPVTAGPLAGGPVTAGGGATVSVG
ncbi:MAG TPA: NAD(P)-dependent oxidoreductase [Acidimicrobiales bacterium]|nr:NAD(P)-dependent oxidoreductase [Acidimicrobiales bacterium]